MAAEILKDGPVHTLDLASAVLRLSGNAGAASAAVFALLGSDQRFKVDSEGRWTLCGSPPGTPLMSLRYAVVDVETTGGPYSGGHRMSELAIYEIRDGAITEEYHTLLNPGRRIPPRIEVVTGITNEMVAAAPAFEHVAGEVAERLEGRIFVAHNVRFDWGFVSRELVDALGEAPRVERLCTVQLARKLLPRVRRRNLDALASHFDIRIHPRHRAHGDALATARILLRLLDEASALGLVDLDDLRGYMRRPRRGRPRGKARQGQQLALLDGGTGG